MFTCPSIMKHTGYPIYDTIINVYNMFKANANRISLELYTNNHGLLGLALYPNMYQDLTGHAFYRISNMVTIPLIQGGNNNTIISNIICQHSEDLCVWYKITTIYKAPFKEIGSIFDYMHLSEFKDNTSGYENIHAYDMIHRL